MNRIIKLNDKKEMIYASFIFYKNGLDAVDNPTFGDWIECGRFVRSAGQSVHLWIGDWLNYGEQTWPDKYLAAIDRTGLDIQTLRNDKWVTARIPIRIRKDRLSFDHYQTLARTDLEAEEMEGLLQEAVDKKISSSAFRKYIQKIEFIYKSQSEKKQVQLSMIKESFDWLYKIARLNREFSAVLDQCPKLFLTDKEHKKLQEELNKTKEKIDLLFEKIYI